MNMIAHSIDVTKEAEGRIVKVSVSGKLRKHDYEIFVPEIDRQIEKHGTIRLRFDLVGFHGWTLGALFQDTKFALKHFSEIDRLAFVGDKQWEKGLAMFCKPFTLASIRYFDIGETVEADVWLREGLTDH